MNNYEKAKEEGIIETAERIVIDYANFSGRESEHRAEFRQETIKHLSSFAEKIKEGVLEDVKMSFRKIGKPGFGEPPSQTIKE